MQPHGPGQHQGQQEPEEGVDRRVDIHFDGGHRLVPVEEPVHHLHQRPDHQPARQDQDGHPQQAAQGQVLDAHGAAHCPQDFLNCLHSALLSLEPV